MRKVISSMKLSETLTLCECNDGFWLWDATRKMNLSIKAKNAPAAFVEALTYYQGRLAKVEGELSTLQRKVDSFLEQFQEDED